LTYSDISITVVDMTTYDFAFGGPFGGPHGGHHASEGPGFGPRALFMARKGRGHGPRGGHGFGGWGGFGPPGPWGRGGRRARRGDVRAAILLLLEEEPRNGYGVMQEIDERSGGEWRPSPGSVYPALSQLEDEGLVRPREDAGRKAFELTDEGRAYVEEQREALGTPWELDEDADGAGSMRETKDLLGQVIRATVQVMQVGDDRQQAEARKTLEETRKSLYRLLAEDDEPSAG
jgi:DNA-binding PadR family transcriptional regulator